MASPRQLELQVLLQCSPSSLVFRVVTRVLVEEGERFERLHPIEKQHAVEVIRLVQRHTGRKSPEREVDLAALAVEASQANLPRARHAAADVGNAETALPVFDDVGS